MSLEQVIAENTQAVRELIATLQASAPAAPASLHVVDAAAPVTHKAAPEKKAEPKKAPAVPKAEPEEKQGGVEYKQIQQLVPKIATDSDGTAKVVALFARYGVARGPELKAEQYDDFYADLVKIQAGELDPRDAEVA